MYNPDYLLENWINHFSNPKGFLETNLWTCLREFREFVNFYEYTIERVASGKDTAGTSDWLKDIAKVSIWSKDVENESDWLKEKVRQALDTYRAPLLQAAAQLASAPYNDYLTILLKAPEKELITNYAGVKPNISKIPYLQFKIGHYLVTINELLGLQGEDVFSTDDVVLFFDEDTVIRRPAYTGKALISTPFRGFGAEQKKYVLDLLFDTEFNKSLTGIAHEMGHYLYWRIGDIDINNGDQSEIVSTVVQQFNTEMENKDEPRYGTREIELVEDWIEEMFADFIGAKIAERDGKGINTFTETGKTLIKRRNKNANTLVQNDYEHPPDILRPLVAMYVDALSSSRKSKEEQKAEALKSWKDFFKKAPFSISDPSTMDIKVVENKTDRSGAIVNVSVGKLSQAVLDAIDVFELKITDLAARNLDVPKRIANSSTNWNEEVQKRMKTVMKDIVKRAENIYEKDKSRSVLELLLDPVVLEAGKTRHGHDVWHPQENRFYTLSHSH